MTPHRAQPAPLPQKARDEGEGAGTPSLVLVAAVAANGVIGANDRLPWRLPDDLARFRRLTLGHAVIMGRRTWESLPRALAGRQNIVVTRQRHYLARDAEVATSLDSAIALVRLPAPVFCIGGGELYRLALPLATALELTEIARDFTGDASFPPLARDEWRETAREARGALDAEGFTYAFVRYERVAPRPSI